MCEEKRERGIVCAFCGEGFGYAGEIPDDDTLKKAFEHEAICPKNPYKKEVNSLKDAIRLLLNEVNCRIEHGANSNGHLEFVEKMLTEILKT